MAETEAKFLNYFFSALNRAEISYAVLRNGAGLPDTLNGSDLDILISKADLKVFYSSVLLEVLNEFCGRIIIETNNQARICIIYCVDGEYGGIQIDIHRGALAYLERDMLDPEWLLSRSETRNNVRQLSNGDDKLLAFLKEILYQGFGGKTVDRLQDIREDKLFKFNDYSTEIEHVFGSAASVLLAETLTGEYNDLKKLTNLLRTELFHGKWRWLWAKAKNYFRKIHRFFQPPGFSVAFIGSDGSGKSTLIKAITPALSDSVHGALFYRHMRPGLLPSLATLFKGKKVIVNEVVSDPHGSQSSGFFGSMLRLGYYSLDYIFGYWLKVYPVMVKKGSIFIFDRYFYDYLIDPKRSRLSLPYFLRRLVVCFFPEPDLIICLGCDPEIMYKRKAELPLEELQRQNEAIKKIAATRKNAVWVDTGGTLQATSEKVMDFIVDKMSSRYYE